MPYCPYTLSAAPSGRWLAPTLGEAQALVRASGTVNDTVILLQKRGANPRVGRELVTTRRSIGYRAQLREVPAVLLPQPTARPDNTAEAGYQGWGADYVTPADFFVPLVTCGQILSNGFCDPGLDAEINKALTDQALQPGVVSEE